MARSQYKNDPFFKEATFCWLTTDRADCITKVRSQDRTNSCFAFAVADVIYAVLYLNGKKPLHCSEQELIDHLYKSFPSSHYIVGEVDEKGVINSYTNAFSYVKNLGISTAEEYPFVGKHQPFQGRAPISGYKIIIHGFETIENDKHDLVVREMEKRPLTGSVILGKNFKSWKPDMGPYTGLTPEEQAIQDEAKRAGLSPKFGRHAVILVGHGIEDGKKYYLCKNSYGEDWGHRGYIRVLREIVKHFWYPINPTTLMKTLKCKKN